MGEQVELDIISVAHRDENYALMMQMFRQVFDHHPDRVKVIPVDNRIENRGFAKGCNDGAAAGSAPIIGFINPDATVHGPFLAQVTETLVLPNVVITGERFGKPDREISLWGCRDWVCGACFFVRRDFWDEVGGFHEGYVWSHEETDMIRVAQSKGRIVKSIHLPIRHASPSEDLPEDAEYKREHFDKGAALFRQRWGRAW